MEKGKKIQFRAKASWRLWNQIGRLNTVTSSFGPFNEVSGIIAPYWCPIKWWGTFFSRGYSRPDLLIAQLFHLELRPTTFLLAYPSLFMPGLLLFIFICPGSCLINDSQPSTKLLSFLPPKRIASSFQSTSPPFPSRSCPVSCFLSPHPLSRSTGRSASLLTSQHVSDTHQVKKIKINNVT